MLKYLKSIYNKEQFQPSFLGIFINPFYFARKGLYESILKYSENIIGKILDVGCGQKPYEKLLIKKTEYVGLEFDSPENRKNKKADYFYNGKTFPFENNEFDSVITSQVLEHVFNPEEFLSEINRVLKINGCLFLTIPFVWDEHEQPYDYARYSSYGLKYLVSNSGFEIIEQRKTMNDIRVIFQLINAYIYKKMIGSNRCINVMVIFFLMFPFNLIGSLLSKFLPRNDDLYLDNVILAKKVKNIEG